MAHVGGQERKLVENVVALLVPLIEPGDGEGMAQVVQSRPAATRLSHAAVRQKELKALVDAGLAVFSSGIAEERFLRLSG